MKTLLYIAALWCSHTLVGQTSITFAGETGAMLVQPFTTDKTPLSIGGQFKLDWRSRGTAYRFAEFGIDKFRFVWQDTKKDFSFTYLRLTTGWRMYPGGTYGMYAEMGLGAFGLITDGYSSGDDALHLGAGVSPGFGYAGKSLCIGIQLPVHLTAYAGIGVNPTIHAGFHIVPKSAR
ncbi:MAG: hypothetical protein ACKVOR_13290 [Flavobacteriales bacterium]